MKATTGGFALVKAFGVFDDTVISTHRTREAAEKAMKKNTGGYGTDSLFTGAYRIVNLSRWEIIDIFGKKTVRLRRT